MKKLPIVSIGALSALIPSLYADNVIPDDLIVQGSAGIGLDSVNGESFGFDTLRLKENNLRIKFQDTSVSASFPSVDWQLTANDTTNGGKNKFSIDDVTNGRTPFTVEASAPSHSLYVDDGGRVGLGTDAPVVELQVVSGDSPTMRLEQDGSSGFTAQTWDVAGNETNFFVRDATNGSRLPFKIRPSAPTNSLYIDTDGDVGLGTASPSAGLDVLGSVEINGDSGLDALTLTNDGTTRVAISNTTTTGTASDWDITVTDAGTLTVKKIGTSGLYTFHGDGGMVIEAAGGFGTQPIFTLDNLGNLTITGALTDTSDMNRKEGISDVDPKEILEKLAAIPVKYWRYKGDEVMHMGPMAQDFYRSFQVGQGETTISKPDADGVALASIQALYHQSVAKDKEIDDLKEANTNLEKRLEALEKMIQARN